EETEPEPVGIVAPLARRRREKALRRRVGADDEGDVAQAGKDLGPGRVQRSRAGRARGVGARDGGALPPERLSERGARDVARVAVPDRVRPGDELDVAPLQPGVLEGGAGGGDAVLDEVAAPLPPRVHAHAEDGDVVITHQTPLLRSASTSRRRTPGRRPRTACRGRARPPRRPAAIPGRHRRRPARAPPSSPAAARLPRPRTARRDRRGRTEAAAGRGSPGTTPPTPRFGAAPPRKPGRRAR